MIDRHASSAVAAAAHGTACMRLCACMRAAIQASSHPPHATAQRHHGSSGPVGGTKIGSVAWSVAGRRHAACPSACHVIGPALAPARKGCCVEAVHVPHLCLVLSLQAAQEHTVHMQHAHAPDRMRLRLIAACKYAAAGSRWRRTAAAGPNGACMPAGSEPSRHCELGLQVGALVMRCWPGMRALKSAHS